MPRPDLSLSEPRSADARENHCHEAALCAIDPEGAPRQMDVADTGFDRPAPDQAVCGLGREIELGNLNRERHR